MPTVAFTMIDAFNQPRIVAISSSPDEAVEMLAHTLKRHAPGVPMHPQAEEEIRSLYTLAAAGGHAGVFSQAVQVADVKVPSLLLFAQVIL